MKIAIPVNEKNIKSGVCPSFGRAPYYLIYDSEKQSSEFIDNAAAQSAGGAGIRAAQTLADMGVKIIIAPRYGENAAQILAACNITVYRNIIGTAEENIKAYKENKLSVLADVHPGFHNHGNR